MGSLHYLCLLLAVCSLGVCEDEIGHENGVLLLTKNNFKTGINTHEHILVEFYAPWCGHCKALGPELEKAVQLLTDQGHAIKIAKVDATIETELAEEHKVLGYPTLKFFKKQQPLQYSGGRQAADIVSWLLKKTGPPAKELNTVEETKAFIDEHKVAVLGFFKDTSSPAYHTYLSVADNVDDHPFAVTSHADLFAEYNVDTGEQIVLFKKFDEGKAVFAGKHVEEDIKKFVRTEALPLVVEFNHETAQKIFGGDMKTHLLLFLSQAGGHFDQYLEGARSIAKDFRDQMLFVTINSDEDDHQRILEFFGMTPEEVPAMRIIRMEEDMAKFKPEDSSLTVDNIKHFVKSFLDGTVKQHYLSQALPDDWDKQPVKVLVANTFDQIVFDTDKDVLVEFYAPWCGHCKQLAPIYDQLGEAFKDNNEVVITKMDATVNELNHTKVTSFPTIKLYAKGDNKEIEYNGERTLDGLTKFLTSGGTYGEAVPEGEETEGEEEEEAVPRDEL